MSKAEKSITVYTPFFDRLLLSLLRTQSDIDPEQITVVTDLVPASLLESPNQLRAIKRAITEGFSIRSLGGLHAKVLLVDDKYATAGSQNFTSKGRRNKEVTVVPSEALDGSRFIETLIGWREQGEEIDGELVDILISKLTRRIKQHKKLLQETQSEFEEILEEHQLGKQAALISRLEELERQSRVRMSRGVIYATIEYLFDGWNSYMTLMADHGCDMTRWIVENSDGTTEPYRLSRLSMYPMILAESHRMGFARIGKTRITYIRNSLNWTNNKLEVGYMMLDVNITFPKTDTKKRNIVVKLSNSYLGSSCEFAVLFTGDSSQVVRKRYFKSRGYRQDQHELFVTALENDFFASTKLFEDFFRRFFCRFTYATLCRDHKNAEDYLKGTRFRLSVIQYQENPFLVITRMQ